jgi:hypothetical protein
MIDIEFRRLENGYYRLLHKGTQVTYGGSAKGPKFVDVHGATKEVLLYFVGTAGKRVVVSVNNRRSHTMTIQNGLVSSSREVLLEFDLVSNGVEQPKYLPITGEQSIFCGCMQGSLWFTYGDIHYDCVDYGLEPSEKRWVVSILKFWNWPIWTRSFWI